MRKTILSSLACLVALLTAHRAVAAGPVTPESDLTLGEMPIPVYGVQGRAPKDTVYPVSDAGSVDPLPALATGANWALEAWTVGRTLGEQPDDFRIGETCTALPQVPGKTIDWARTYATNSVSTNEYGFIFNLDATNESERVIFTRSGPSKIVWIMSDGEPVPVDYQIGRSVSSRPYRLYATRADEGNLVAYVNLSGKYVRFFGDSALIAPVTNRPVTVEGGGTNGFAACGLDYNAQSGLLTYRYHVDEKTGAVMGTQGQFVLAYYDTESKDHMIAHIVVEVTLPRVNTLTAHVGEELRPLGGGFNIVGLSPAVNSGNQTDADDPCSPYLEIYETPKSTATGDEKGQLKLYALAPTDVSTSKLGMDMPWKIDVYWRSPDPMGTLWTFEDDWYLVTWPESAPQVVTSGDAANPGYPLVLPSTYSVSVLNYRTPLYMNVSYDSSTHRVVADDTGRFVLRLTVGENGRPYFLPVECVKHDDARVCAGPVIPWPVGREITICRGEVAGSAAAVAAKMDSSLPGYIHVPSSKGRNWNPKLYHFNAGGAVDGMIGSVTENNAFASLVSSIYGVNESPDSIEVWWSGSYRGDKGKGNELPEAVTYPGFVQRFRVRWDLAELEGVYPTIRLYSQKGSADETMTSVQSLGLHLSRTNSAVEVTAKDRGIRFRAYERLHLGFSISSLQCSNDVFAVRCGRIATVRDTGNRRIALEISVTETDAEGYTVVTRGAGFETVSNRYEHLAWNDFAVEVPPKLADARLEISFGDTGADGEPSAVNIVLDDLACWHGEQFGPKDVDNVEFYFAFGEEDADTDEDARHGRTVGAILGASSLTCRHCDFSLGAPTAYDGIFSAENGIAPEIYYQNDSTQIGYNPNEEHAFLEETADGYVAWALRNDLNFADTSHAMVFVQYAEDGKGRMDAFRIGDVRAVDAVDSFVQTVLVGKPVPVPKPIGLLSGAGSAEDQAEAAIYNPEDVSTPLYRDCHRQFWAWRNGQADVTYKYPCLKSLGFYCPTLDGDEPEDGELIGWMNNLGLKTRPTRINLCMVPSKVPWSNRSEWPPEDSVPTMRVGQILTTAEKGLPEMWNAASMSVLHPNGSDPKKRIVDLIDPTVAQTARLKMDTIDFPSEFGFTVGPSGNCMLRKGKYYFTGCPPSVSDRFYVDANAAEDKRVVLIGDRVEKESGGSYLRLNVLTPAEREALKGLCRQLPPPYEYAKARWDAAIDLLATDVKKVSSNGVAEVEYINKRKPFCFQIPDVPACIESFKKNIASGYVVIKDIKIGPGLSTNVVTRADAGVNFAAVNFEKETKIPVWPASGTYKSAKERYEREICSNLCYTVTDKGEKKPIAWPWTGSTTETNTLVEYSGTFSYVVIGSEKTRVQYDAKDHLALVTTGDDTGWVTLIENDDPDPAHVTPGLPVQMHVIRVVDELHLDGIAVVTDPLNKLSEQLSLLYKTPLGAGAENFEFEWRRTKPKSDGTLEQDRFRWDTYTNGVGLTSLLLGAKGANPDEYVNTYYTLRYRRKGAGDKDWTGFAEPQLAEGWLQRVLNSVTPFAQRVEDFYTNPSDIGYTMLEQIGKPYTGDVALNNENLTQVGLMELYQTLFNRVESMLASVATNDTVNTTDLSKQLMLAATRLNELYALLGAEAYSDAKNPLIGSEDGTAFPAGTFSFANQVATLLDEELALLRGRAATPAFPRMTEAPCYNRLAWNFTKGITEGEPAYVNNYGIRARDGIMDVNCAAAQYPQGHGDAWGHYLSALKIYYRLLRNPAFKWTVSMMEMLMDQKITNVDYQDEQKFADTAAKLAQTGLDAFDLTLRKAYKEGDVGLFDSNTNQAFGCGEWATRTEMGAVYNWMVGNALLPTNGAPYREFTDRGIMKIDRTTALSLSSLCTAVETLDKKLADYGAGMNPLGLAEGAIPFDIDPARLAEKSSHFVQILERTEGALANCRTVLDYANVYGSRLRQLQEKETDALAERAKTELAYNNQLIAIYGTPFPGDIGPGGTYPQGYEGPDIYNYNCMDLTPYGLEDGIPAVNTTLVTNFVRSGLSYNKTNEVPITYRVTPGGIRMMNANMTGVRATEGTIQAKYRQYLTAYQAYQGAIASYGAAVKTLQTASSDAAYKTGTSMGSLLLSVGELVNEIFFQIYDADLSTKNWEMVRDGLNNIEMALYKQSGITIAGMAAGGDQLKQILQKQAELTADAAIYNRSGGLGVDMVTKVSEFGNIDFSKGIFDEALLESDWGGRGSQYMSNFLGTRIKTPDHEGSVISKAILNVVRFVYDNVTTQIEMQRDLRRSVDDAIDGVSTAIGGIDTAIISLQTAEAEYRAEQYRGELLQDERALWRQQMSNEATASRYADMFNRMQRNIALTKYSTAFDTAQRYVWELAKVYDYETGLLSSDEKSGKQFLADIVATRSLGVEGVPIASGTTDGGLYDVVARMKANWNVLEGRLGINNPDKPTKWFSLRHDLCEISLNANQDEDWRKWLRGNVRDDIGKIPEFIRYCQPLALSEEGKKTGQGPGIVLTFGTSIYGDKNFFGKNLKPGDTQFSAADYATKIDAVGVYFQGYDEFADAGGAFVREPNVYLVPIGEDCMYSPAGTDDRQVLRWSVVDQVLPLPYTIGSAELDNPSWISTVSGPSGSAANIRRHSTLRMGYNLTSNRLVGRSVWNTKWMLIIPARSVGSENRSILFGAEGGKSFVDKVKDIKIGVRAYSRQGN